MTLLHVDAGLSGPSDGGPSVVLMAPLLVLVLGAIALPLVPRRARWIVPIVVASVELALVVSALTGEPSLVVGAAVVGALAGLLVREIMATFSLLSAPTHDARRERDRMRREAGGEPTDEDRELRRQERERRRRRDRLAA